MYKIFFARILIKNFSIRTEKDEYGTTFCESCEQPVWSNALQEVVQEAAGRGHVELQITLQQREFCDMQCDAVMTSSRYEVSKL